MIDAPRPLLDDEFAWEPLAIAGIDLSPEQLHTALTLSQTTPSAHLPANALHPWQIYLNALALAGFETWLQHRASDLVLHADNCSLSQALTAHLIDAVCQLQVGEFRLCLVVNTSLSDTVISIPQAAIALAPFHAHFYVLVEVQEEQSQVVVQAYLRADQLHHQLQATNLKPNSEFNYSIPTDWFAEDPDGLLLALHCLTPSAISLPQFEQPEEISRAALQERCRRLTGDRPWYEQLRWQELATLLTHPDWITSSSERTTPQTTWVPEHLSQCAMNVGLWFQNQLDAVAQELSWVLLPPLTPESGLRSGATTFEPVMHNLSASGIHVPHEARAAYRDLHWGNIAVRLYAVTWSLAAVSSEPEWMLLLVLGPQPSTPIPNGVRLMVRDSMQWLVDREVVDHTTDSYLYAQVVGTWDEQFWVTIDFTHGAVVTLPPFAFHLRTDE